MPSVVREGLQCGDGFPWETRGRLKKMELSFKAFKEEEGKKKNSLNIAVYNDIGIESFLHFHS